MNPKGSYDAVIVGAGPNGLSAAVRLARAGCSTLLVEARDTIGGGARTAELTLPGFRHDVCSAIHPLGMGSPFFQSLPLGSHGLEWIQPPKPLVHPVSSDCAVALERSIPETASGLGRDEAGYLRWMGPLATEWNRIAPEILAPVLHWPRHPWLMARFGLSAMTSAVRLGNRRFKEERTRALWAGLAAHSVLPLDRVPSAAVGLVLAMAAHAVGWPMPRAGAQMISDALAAYYTSLGGEIRTGYRVDSIGQLPSARIYLFDTTPGQLVRLAGDQLSRRDQRRLNRFRHGPGIFKVDWALDGPIPWKNPACAEAGTVHVGGTLEEVAASERAVWNGAMSERPFVLLAQPTLFDPTRAPAGKHTAWAYCHVPSGSVEPMTDRIENQVERFAPGFKDRILARHTMNTRQLENYNVNNVGGDIGGGVADLVQTLFRPVCRRVPYATSHPRIFLCSASTPPGPGVHGMCGYHAAEAALRSMRIRSRRNPA